MPCSRPFSSFVSKKSFEADEDMEEESFLSETILSISRNFLLKNFFAPFGVENQKEKENFFARTDEKSSNNVFINVVWTITTSWLRATSDRVSSFR